MNFQWNSIVPGCVNEQGVATFKCLPALFSNITVTLLSLAGVAALIFIIFSGIKFITSGGDSKQLEGARKTLTYAIIGLIIIFLAYFIVNAIATLTGAHCIFNPLNPTACQ